jgi:hypothetical protein
MCVHHFATCGDTMGFALAFAVVASAFGEPLPPSTQAVNVFVNGEAVPGLPYPEYAYGFQIPGEFAPGIKSFGRAHSAGLHWAGMSVTLSRCPLSSHKTRCEGGHVERRRGPARFVQ